MTSRYTTIHDAPRDPRHVGTYGAPYRALRDMRPEQHADACHDAAVASGECTADAYGCVEWFDFDAPGARARRLEATQRG